VLRQSVQAVIASAQERGRVRRQTAPVGEFAVEHRLDRRRLDALEEAFRSEPDTVRDLLDFLLVVFDFVVGDDLCFGVRERPLVLRALDEFDLLVRQPVEREVTIRLTISHRHHKFFVPTFLEFVVVSPYLADTASPQRNNYYD
jgi:hypothetical protein